MKQILLAIIFIFSSFFICYAEEFKTVADIFPKASSMKGGSSAWLVSGVSSKQSVKDNSRCTLYENTYAYYSEKKEKILGIERANTYVVSARIFDCNNFAEALKVYNGLSTTTRKLAKSKQFAAVPFGEQGIMVALPLQASQSKSQQANFYVTYIYRNFVVQVYSDDGFAQMDMSGMLENNIMQYLKTKNINYAINKINLQVDVDNSTYMDSLSFTGNNIKSVLISGIVLDANNKPVSDAKITAMETKQTTTTDKNGKFNFTVTSGNGKSISMVKTIMLPFNISGEKLAISTGFYPIEVTKKDKIILNGLLNILVKDNKLTGYMTDTALDKKFHITGSVHSDNITIDVNCTEPSSMLNCRKIFKGNLISDSIIKGVSIGSGGSGNFIIDKNKWTIVTESHYLRDIGLSLKLSILQNGQQKYSSQNNIPLNASDNSKSYLELLTDNYIGKDLTYFKSAFLKLKVLDLNIKNKAEIVLYKRIIDKNGKITMQKIAPLTAITKDNSKEIILDISSQIRLPNKDGYFIGLVGEEKDYIIFDNNTMLVDISYYRDVTIYKSRKVLSLAVKNFNGKDIVANKKSIEKDGKEDIVLSLNLSAKGRELSMLEVTATADIKRVWNTTLGNIYPVVAVLQNDTILNESNSTIKIPLKSDEEIFDLHLYKGSLKEEDIKEIKIKAVIDNKIYEDSISLK